MQILVINPGSTSTKIAVYQDLRQLFQQDIKHSAETLSKFASIPQQHSFRKRLVLKVLQENSIGTGFDAVIGRGSLAKPIEGGVYAVNEAMREDAVNAVEQHACNLGCLIAHEIASSLPRCRAFIADPGVVDELDAVARITGSPLMPKHVVWHALNQKAIARRYARERGTSYECLTLVIAHLGGGISVATHRGGRAVDTGNALSGDGPFSPERIGTVQWGTLIDICYSGQYTKEELKRRCVGNAGLTAHLGTNHVPEILQRIEQGDIKAKLVMDAMIYNIAKSIGAAATVVSGKVDAILLTGGMAHAQYITERITERVSFIAPVKVYPGEDEMQALAESAYAALTGALPVKTYC